MDIEEAIKQTKPFSSPYEKAVVNIVYTHNWLKGEMKTYLGPYGLTTKQYNILRILKGAGQPVSTSYIRERLLDKVSDVSRIVDRMEIKELLQKNVCSKDKRLVDLTLTSKGLELVQKLGENTELTDKLLEKLDPNEINQLNQLLDKLRS